MPLLLAHCGDDAGDGGGATTGEDDVTADAATDDSGGQVTEDSATTGDDDTGAGDTTTEDTGKTEDVFAVDCSTDPGQPWCACESDTDCNNGLCLDSHLGGKCAGDCEGGCPDGFVCKKPSSDADPVCTPRIPFLCMPCLDDGDCDTPGFSGD